MDTCCLSLSRAHVAALPHRVRLQLELALARGVKIGRAGVDAGGGGSGEGVSREAERVAAQQLLLIGGGFIREPADAMPLYTAWGNDPGLVGDKLHAQQWRECSIIQPTWFLSRVCWDAIGGWDETIFDERTAGGGDAEDPLLPRKRSFAEGGAAGGVGSGRDAAPPAKRARGDSADGHTGAEPPIATPTARSPSTTVVLKGLPPVTVPDLSARPRRVDASSHGHRPFPEDTIFFHRFLHAGGRLERVPEPVLIYRYSPLSQSWRISTELLMAVRARLFEQRMLAPGRPWASGFTIWGAGRDGKNFYNALSPAGQALVRAFCDVDPKKIGQVYPLPPKGATGKRARAEAAASAGAGDVGGSGSAASTPSPRTRSVPIIHFSAGVPPIVCCVSMRCGGDELVRNADKLALREGTDFWFFC